MKSSGFHLKKDGKKGSTHRRLFSGSEKLTMALNTICGYGTKISTLFITLEFTESLGNPNLDLRSDDIWITQDVSNIYRSYPEAAAKAVCWGSSETLAEV
jgi:hypothetical protein